MEYNPYELIPIVILGQTIYARPIEYDSSPINNNSTKNAFGNHILPTKITYTCPGCGQGKVSEVRFESAPLRTVEIKCYDCEPDIPEMPNPFLNPLADGILKESDLYEIAASLKPKEVKAKKQDKKASKPRAMEAVSTTPLVDTSEAKTAIEDPNPEFKLNKISKRRLEPAEGISAIEANFDDQDLIEP